MTEQVLSKERKRGLLRRLVGLIVLLWAGAWGCLDQISLDVPRGVEETLVIQGSVIKGDPSIIRVSVSRLFDFTSNSLQPVNVRSVVLRDDAGNEVDLRTDELGLYELDLPANDARMQIEAGKSYQLFVNTFDGRLYVSSLEPLLELPRVDNLSAERVIKEIPDGMGGFEDRPFIEYRISTPLGATEAGATTYLRWVIERTYQVTDSSAFSLATPKTCYITQQTEADNIVLFDPTVINVNRLDDFSVFEDLANFYYAEGHYLTVYQQAIPEGAHRYWDQISSIIDRTGNMFEPPAGKIVTNFQNANDPSDEVFGYFFVTQQDTVRLYVSPEEAGSPRRLCPPANEQSPDGSCPFDLCCNCLSDEGSTINKPDFWQY